MAGGDMLTGHTRLPEPNQNTIRICCRGRTRTGDLTSEGTRYLLIAVTVELSALPLGVLWPSELHGNICDSHLYSSARLWIVPRLIKVSHVLEELSISFYACCLTSSALGLLIRDLTAVLRVW